MKISYNWLNDYVSISDSPEKLAKILTDTGLEIEGFEKTESVQGGLSGVVVGEVVACEKHPDADRLKITHVDVGSDELLQIVCGAPNVAKGQKVLVATVGTTLYPNPNENFKIKKSKIRGVESLGMICAEDELGIGTSHDGILVLDPQTQVGIEASKALHLEDDYALEIGLTPNRADALGIIGVARDYIAYKNIHEQSNLSLSLPKYDALQTQNEALLIDINIEDTDLCPKYAGVSITGVNIAPSPEWLQKKLLAIGVSPINNVVDVTNFVMRELGTPLHAFDAQKLNGKIVVKKAKNGEKFTTLDGVERTLSDANLMITNGIDNLCLAGILGGQASGVSDETKSIFIESAYFDAVSIRKSAKEHALNTDASFRYERGVDPALTEYALRRCVALILEVAGGTVSMNENVTGSLTTTQEVNFNIEKCNQLIGSELSPEIIKQILRELEIQIKNENGNNLILQVPAYRVDVTREVDVIEEVLRIYGFNKVELPNKMNLSIVPFPKLDLEKIKFTLSEFLVGKGFFEIMNNSLTKSSYVEKLGGDELTSKHHIELLNPLSNDLNVMRQSLLFHTLETIAYNQNRQNPNLSLFEFGKVYHKKDSYLENQRIMIAVSGKKYPENWIDSNEEHSFYSLKGIVMAIFERLGLEGFIQEKAIDNQNLMDGIQFMILKKPIAKLGIVNAKLRSHFGIKNHVFAADIDWDVVCESLKMVKTIYKELPKTFKVRRDFSLLLNSQIQYTEIVDLAKKCDKKILSEVGLFDVYEGKNLPEGKKSYALSFIFQDNEKTLNDSQVDAVMNKIRQQLETQLGAELR